MAVDITPDVVIRELMSLGMPYTPAVGFAANFMQESGLDPTINELNPLVQGSRGGYGLAQWTGPRRRALESWSHQQNLSLGELGTQAKFLMHELGSTEKSARDAIYAAKTPREATELVSNIFLRPGIPHMDRRLGFSEEILRNYPETYFTASRTPFSDIRTSDMVDSFNPITGPITATPSRGSGLSYPTGPTKRYTPGSIAPQTSTNAGSPFSLFSLNSADTAGSDLISDFMRPYDNFINQSRDLATSSNALSRAGIGNPRGSAGQYGYISPEWLQNQRSVTGFDRYKTDPSQIPTGADTRMALGISPEQGTDWVNQKGTDWVSESWFDKAKTGVANWWNSIGTDDAEKTQEGPGWWGQDGILATGAQLGSTLGDLWGAWNAHNQQKSMEKYYDSQMAFANRNLANQSQLINNSLKDQFIARQGGMGNAPTEAEIAAHMINHRVDGSPIPV